MATATRQGRTRIAGLRSSDALTLSVLIPDVLRQPLGQIHPETLTDLFALAVAEGLPASMARDLARFVDQMCREVADLPDGAALESFLTELAELPPEAVPARLREALARREAQPDLKPGAAAALAGFRAHLAAAEPALVRVAERKRAQVERPAVPDSHRSPVEREREARRSPRGAPKPRATPAAQRDQRREDWIREDMLERLRGKGPSGLKEAILLAGARHRSPFKDLSDDEVRAVLRKLGREGLVNHSAGRWALKGVRF